MSPDIRKFKDAWISGEFSRRLCIAIVGISLSPFGDGGTVWAQAAIADFYGDGIQNADAGSVAVGDTHRPHWLLWLVAAASDSKGSAVSSLEAATAAQAVSVASEPAKSRGRRRPADTTQKSGNSIGGRHDTTTDSTG